MERKLSRFLDVERNLVGPEIVRGGKLWDKKYTRKNGGKDRREMKVVLGVAPKYSILIESELGLSSCIVLD